MSEARARAVVHGRVQGVGYRAATRDRASDLGLRGWVRNEIDGTVVILAEGPRDRVEALMAWCWTGPGFAAVTDVSIAWEAPAGLTGGFLVTR